MEAPDLSLTRPVLHNEAEKKLWETIILQQTGGIVVEVLRSTEGEANGAQKSLEILAVIASMSAKFADRMIELRRGRVDDEVSIKKPIQLV